MFEWAYDGAYRGAPRNVGPECANFLTAKRRIIETGIVSLICITILVKIYHKLIVFPSNHHEKNLKGKQILLVTITLLWGMEIGFKFASRSVIYLLNPCHITTAMQIYLLAAPPSKKVTAVFRFHLNLLNGPLLAFLFPETASRKIPMEAALYWIQHGLMCVIPCYLICVGGPYNVEPLNDYNWCIASYCINLLYHFILLQTFAIPSQVNLNHMLCPAILDPFDGEWYRVAAVTHQAILCPFLAKSFHLLSCYILDKFPPTNAERGAITCRCCDTKIE